MKIRSFIAVVPLCLLSFSAFAGGNCIYGKDKVLAASAIEDAVIAEKIAEKVDPTLLALLRKQQAEKELTQKIITFN